MPQNTCGPPGGTKSSKGSYKFWMLNVQQYVSDGQPITNADTLYKIIRNYFKIYSLNTDVPHPSSNMKFLSDSFFLEHRIIES